MLCDLWLSLLRARKALTYGRRQQEQRLKFVLTSKTPRIHALLIAGSGPWCDPTRFEFEDMLQTYERNATITVSSLSQNRNHVSDVACALHGRDPRHFWHV